MDGQKQADKPAESKKAGEAEERRRFFMDVRKPNTGKTDTSDVPKPAADSPVPEPAKPVDTTEAPEPAEATELAQKAPTPADDPVAAPPEEVAKKTDDPAVKLEEPKKAKVTKPPKPPRQPGVGLAIFATVVIVLALAALATYAYLRSNNIEVF